MARAPDWFAKILQYFPKTKGISELAAYQNRRDLAKRNPDFNKVYPPSRDQWADLTIEQKREYNLRVHGISTIYYVQILPYVPNAIRDLPFTLRPVWR